MSETKFDPVRYIIQQYEDGCITLHDACRAIVTSACDIYLSNHLSEPHEETPNGPENKDLQG